MNTIKKPYLVGITGGSASGKTHFLKELSDGFASDQLCILSQDNYYKRAFEHKRDEQGHINFDLPECIDFEKFIHDLNALISGTSIEIEEYLFQHVNLVPRKIHIKSAPIIIVEGLFVFHYREFMDQFNLKVFIQAKEEIALERRLKRDVAERNIEPEFVMYQWENHVMPAFKNYLLPNIHEADLIINNNIHFHQSLKVLKDHLRSELERIT